MAEEKVLETKYLTRVTDQMQQLATKENKVRGTIEKLLPLKLHLRDWECKLGLNEKIEDSFEKRVT